MTNAELVVLTLVAERPRHGYQIEQLIAEREMREWTELGFSSIYYVLNKLEEQALIESHLEKTSGRGPARKVYTITRAGQEVCREGILHSLAEPPRPETMFLLGLANLPAVSKDEALSALKLYAGRLADRKEQLLKRVQIREGMLPFHVEAMFDFSLNMIQAELSWLKQFIQEVEG